MFALVLLDELTQRLQSSVMFRLPLERIVHPGAEAVRASLGYGVSTSVQEVPLDSGGETFATCHTFMLLHDDDRGIA
jgi:hypothetical protein